MGPETSLPNPRFYVEWIASNAIATFLGFPISLFLTATLFGPVLVSACSEISIPLIMALSGSLHGIIYGLIQWRKLSAWGLHWGRWVPLSALGWSLACLGAVAGLGLVQRFSQTAGLPGWFAAGAIGLYMGLAVGACQSLAVSRVSSSLAWIAANGLALASGAALLALLVSAVPFGEGPGEGTIQGLAALALMPLPGILVGLSTAWSISTSVRREHRHGQIGAG